MLRPNNNNDQISDDQIFLGSAMPLYVTMMLVKGWIKNNLTKILLYLVFAIYQLETIKILKFLVSTPDN